jgi:hypothetical protein
VRKVSAMKQRVHSAALRRSVLVGLLLAVLLAAGCRGDAPTATPLPPSATPILSQATATRLAPTPSPSATPLPPTATRIAPTASPTPTATGTTAPAASDRPDEIDALSLISQESLYAFLEDLTSIQPYSGWRNSATTGEAEALDYVADTLGGYAHLQALGLELERQSFHVFLATELWDTRLYVTTGGTETEVPADAPRGHRHDVYQALRFDSDGVLNDAARNPVEVVGEVVLIRSPEEIDVRVEIDLAGKIVFLDYATIDRATSSPGEDTRIVTRLINRGAAGLVLVTQFSAAPEESHGAYVGDGFALESVATKAVIPTLYVRLEDLAPAGISGWDDLAQIETARLIWDSDVFAPGTSGNLVARIPGADASRAMILGAHIDSPNSPGALDNGVGSVVLLEVARVLNVARIQPAVDLYLVWFGSEELWLYGSQHFVNTHQELLDRTVAVYEMDSFIIAMPDDFLQLAGWSHSRFGDDRLTFVRYLVEKATARNIDIDEIDDYQGIGGDSYVFNGFVPVAGIGFGSANSAYAHSPYDTVEIVYEMGDLLEQVTAVALIAALETGKDLPVLRVTPPPVRRALIVATHTEALAMTGTTLIELDRALAWEGFDVDVIPYGQAVTPDGLAEADLVIVLPVIDYPGPDGDVTVYDEAWREEEIAALVAYVERGGLLVLTNSAHRIQLFGIAFDNNEDWPDLNPLAERFGILFEEGTLASANARGQGEHPLLERQSSLTLIDDNAIPFTMRAGETLATVRGTPVVGLVDVGAAGGQVLVLADVGILGFAGPEESTGRDNFNFLRNLARYAHTR